MKMVDWCRGRLIENLIAIDPGAGHFAWARVWEGVVVACGVVEGRPVELFNGAEKIAFLGYRVIIERPQIYPSRRQKGDPNDLISVALTAGLVVGALGVEPIYVLPARWKGNTPKKVHQQRILGKLKFSERCLIDQIPARRRGDVVDAVGLAKWAAEGGIAK